MNPKIIGSCPICHKKLIATELKCKDCGTTIKGEFQLSNFDYLSLPQQDFIQIFLKNAGNIKQIEKDLNISYPTVKKMLEDILVALNLKSNVNLDQDAPTRQSVLNDLKEGKIDFKEAEEQLNRIDNKGE